MPIYHHGQNLLVPFCRHYYAHELVPENEACSGEFVELDMHKYSGPGFIRSFSHRLDVPLDGLEASNQSADDMPITTVTNLSAFTRTGLNVDTHPFSCGPQRGQYHLILFIIAENLALI